jgi:hypothetical protein
MLFQNRPNPFNASTLIIYHLPRSGFVILKIVDILGGEVEILEEGYQFEGMHRVSWNASGQASGLYLCILEVQTPASQWRQTKKLLLDR